MYIYPPKITHLHVRTDDDRGELCSSCSSSLHMSKGEVKLLRYYAEQANGFKPAVKRICDETGLCRRQVFYAREMLIKHGLIAVDEDRVYIDWERIRLFSTLDPAFTNKHCFIASVKPEKLHYKVYYPSKRLLIKLQSCTMDEACKLFREMSESQYHAVRRCIAAS